MSKETRAFKKGRGAQRTFVPKDPSQGQQTDWLLKRLSFRNFPDSARGIVKGMHITSVEKADPVKADQIWLKPFGDILPECADGGLLTVQKGIEGVKAKSQSNLTFNANLKAVIAEI